MGTNQGFFSGCRWSCGLSWVFPGWVNVELEDGKSNLYRGRTSTRKKLCVTLSRLVPLSSESSHALHASGLRTVAKVHAKVESARSLEHLDEEDEPKDISLQVQRS